MKAFTSVKIKTTPLVNHYLTSNFGSPCVIPSGHFISEHLNILLSRPRKDDNNYCKEESCEVEILINKLTFKRYGFGLTRTNRRNFNIVITNYIKWQIRTMTSNLLHIHNVNNDFKKMYEDLKKENKALVLFNQQPVSPETKRKFKKLETTINKRLEEHATNLLTEKKALLYVAHEVLGFTENILPYDTIKKDFYRYKKAKTTHCY